MKKLFFIALTLTSWCCVNAQGLVPKPIPCYEPKIFTPAYESETNPKIDFKSYNCVDIYGPLALDTPNIVHIGRTDVVAGKSIRLGPGTHIGPLPDPIAPSTIQHYFHAYIEENDFEVVWFEPNDSPGIVGQYDKLEFGVKLPAPLDSMIYNFVHHNTTSTIEWMNPFDPDAINVEAEFMYLGTGYNMHSPESSKTRFGFYYEEYERVVNSNTDVFDDGWNQDTTSYSFRIRFSPNKIGNWAVKIKIETPIGNYEALPVTFECVGSDNPGFVKVGPSNTFLSIGDNNDDFYPIGMNLEWPRCDELVFDSVGVCPWVDDLNNYSPAPAWNYNRYDELMTALADGGANYFRHIITPWTYDVEFEELGNYSDKMINAWELDQAVKKAEELNLKMQMCLTVHYNFENPSGYTMTNWDWEKNTMPVGDNAYGYADDLGLTIEEFFSDPIARKYYKNRLRYLLSRINYSSSIGVYEIASEINNFGTVAEYTTPDSNGYSHAAGKTLYAPYHQDSSFATAGGEWLEYMADYIKNGLEIDEHPLASCYTGDPYNQPFDDINGVEGGAVTVMGDESIESPLFDIGAFNYYQTTLEKWKNTKQNVDNHVYGYGNPDVWLHKPLMHAETGMADVYDCATPVDWIREVYISPFTGIAGAFHWHFSFRTDLWAHYGNVMDFLNMVLPYNHISTSTWKPFHNYIETTGEEPQVEVYSLVNDYTSNSDRTFGIVVNRTYNSLSIFNEIDDPYTQTHCDTVFQKLITASDGPAAFSNELRALTSIADVDGGHKLKIHEMEDGDYNINWYNPFDMSIIQVNGEHVSTFNHDLELDFPDLVVSEGDPDYLPFVFFTAYKGEAKSLVIQSSDTATIPISAAARPYTCTIYPNPQNSLSPVNIHCGLSIKKVSLYTSAGRLVQTYDKVTGTINLPLIGRGIYQIKIVLEDETIQNHRLVVLD